MADTKISAFPEVTEMLGSDAFVIARAGTNQRIVGSTLRSNIALVPMPGSFADTVDSNFVGTLGPWTAVAGTEGTVSLLETSTSVARYDLSSALGWLLIQTGHAAVVQFRLDYELEDGASIIVPVMFPGPSGGDMGRIQLIVNDNDTTSQTGAYLNVGIEQDTTEWVTQAFSSVDTTGIELTLNQLYLGQTMFLRISRTGTTWVCHVSLNGIAWQYVYRQLSVAVPYSNIWIYVIGATAGYTYMPVVAIPWTKVLPATAIALA